MRNLSSQPNVTAPSSAYPDGNIRNKDNTANPPVVGTPIIEQIYGDVIEFFQKLKRLAGITANGLPDNETNGHQAVDALNYFVDVIAITRANAAYTAATIYANGVANTASVDATTKANAAQAAAISTAASDATTKANAAQSAAASDATTKANAAQSAAQSYADELRGDGGDQSAYDWADTDLSSGNSFHELDLSSKIPVEAKAVILHVKVGSTTVGNSIAFRKKGNSNQFNISECPAMDISNYWFYDCVVFVSTDRKIEYKRTALNVLISFGGYI